MVIFIEPILGLLAFRLFGATRLGRRRNERHAEVNAIIAARTREMPRPLESVPAPAYVRSVAKLNRHLGALPVTEGNVADLLEDYTETLGTMAAAIDEAERFVHIEFYIMAWDDQTGPVFEALVRATERGVRVRLLFDHLGTRGIPGYKDFLERLQGTDIDWHPMLPIKPLKTALAPSGPAQPPQDPRRRRARGLHGLAQPHRARLQQAQEPRGGTGVEGADDPSGGTGGRHAGRCLLR